LDGLDKPVELTHAGDSSGRLFLLEQAGRILIARDGNMVGEPYLNITGRVGSNGSEQGLLGLAYHPDYPRNGYFYVNYTDRDGNTVISRFSVSGQNPDVADPDSEKRLFYISQPYPNHNGGSVVFGPDGYLYLGLGDGGAGGDPQGNAQNTGVLLGKILRIDVDHGDPYAIPPDNPFAQGGGAPEVWAYGLRNPWRFSFDALTSDLYIGDVGQNAWEEIDYLPANAAGGVNFGWDYREGNHPFEGPVPASVELVDPVSEYGHDQGCSVTGGLVYRGQMLPEWQGVYLYGDYCSGSVWGLVRGADGAWQHALVFDSGGRISSFGEDETGEIYIIGHGGRVFRLVRK
jgi:glucose/arabinose dehydrogenase